MDEEFQKFLHSQFSEAHDSQHTTEELSHIVLNSEERYLDKIFLAEGGQKKILKCTDLLTGRSIAYATVKENSSAEQTAKFIREARLTAHLEHPNIIPVYDTGKDEAEKPFFTMKLISGESFEHYLSKSNSLTDKIDILIKICDAVRFAHNKGIIHFDIKPENIQVSEFGEVLLCDWGLAGIAYEYCSDELLNDELLKKVDLNQSLDTYFKGTAGYAAPEMWQKNTTRDVSADIYSLGAVLYKVLSQKVPEIKPVLSHMNGPNALLAVCSKAIAPLKEDRYQSVDDFLNDLSAWRNGFATKAEQAGFITQAKLLILRHKNVSISILASLVILAIVTSLFINSVKVKEKKATELASSLQLEENKRHALEEELKPKYLENAYHAFKERDFKSTLALCDHILRNGDSTKAEELKGLVYLSQQKFTEALPFLQEGSKLKLLVEKFSSKVPLSVDHLVEFISRLKRERRKTEMILYKNLLLAAFEGPLSIGQKEQLIIGEIKYKSKSLKEVNVSLKETPEGLVIDLSNNPKISELWILQKFGNSYIKSLNLSGTPGGLKEIIDNLQIEGFILRYWPKRDISYLQGRRVLHLDVADSQLDVSYVIEKMPLVTLNIKNAPFKQFDSLSSLKFLKKLTVSKNQLPDEVIKKLPSAVEVIIK
ncbi:MAG: serine/threonine protein kinase [Lentisphaerales bacterium]|nr:serine/threonine protein kinase [Lentisphaerales bacterium]